MNPTPTLRICRTNADRFALPLSNWEERGWNVDCADCLAQCGDCEAGPFVELNGDLLFTDTLPELAEKLASVSQARA
ncbi:MAG: hypothetical protein ACAH89_05015 [Rariglobus sp.]|nr:hypothetical protein [Rariglobus sp.]